MFQLIQNKEIVAESKAVEDLAFDALSSRADWSVVVCFPEGKRTILTVQWSDAALYGTALWRPGMAFRLCNKRLYHSTIIPTAKRALSAAGEQGEFASYQSAGEWTLRIAPIGENLW